MSTFRLTDGSSNVDFSPHARGKYDQPPDRNRLINSAIDKTLYIYDLGSKESWIIPLNNISKVDFDKLRYWWDNRTALKLISEKFTISGTGIAFNDNNPDKDTITDTGNGFVSAGFLAGHHITVSGSTSNDGDYVLYSVAAGTLTLTAAGALTTEAAGDNVTIKIHYDNCYIVNEGELLVMMGGTGWNNKYEGTLLIREG